MSRAVAEWIAFDAVGTLIFADPPGHLAYFRIGRRFGSQIEPGAVLRRFQSALRRRSDADRDELAAGLTTEDGEQAERKFWRQVVADVLPDVKDFEACFEELYAHFASPEAWQCYADVEETLAEARARGYRTAIASNFDGRLHRICDEHPVLASIDERVISSEVRSRKPQPAFYRALLERCGCSAEELIYVGDDPENDVAAPRKLGIRALHLDRSGHAVSALRSLTDLWSVLDSGGPAL